ncbi:proteinase inhibitor [Xenorhabdus beddingii]|uniref:Proteinase inhibitor n=1 Tax=Xenorhabdus beddingii TaxID=40578 RepID=A0A1Y2SPV6_9GAMM|nr:AprI/Inh family metalloprotease inhibitor [Xenorhabdus beddingii]OTA19772.1 proteinase inhibitor [Xenorhabdus beddingii]
MNDLDTPEIEELTGFWMLLNEEEHHLTNIELTGIRLPEGTIWELRDIESILSSILGKAVVGWRPAPDGITVTDKEGYRLAFFGALGGQWVTHLINGKKLIIKPFPQE